VDLTHQQWIIAPLYEEKGGLMVAAAMARRACGNRARRSDLDPPKTE
jgi:hypothetical protein